MYNLKLCLSLSFVTLFPGRHGRESSAARRSCKQNGPYQFLLAYLVREPVRSSLLLADRQYMVKVRGVQVEDVPKVTIV